MRPIVDPSFPAVLHQLRKQRELSLRALGDLVSYSHTQVWEWETGRAQPTPENVAKLDDALGAGGKLTALLAEPTSPLNSDDVDRVDYVTRNPRTADSSAVESFGIILAHQRRLEDRVGSGALLSPVVGQLAVLETLAVEARAPIRTSMVDMAAQWAQFAGWLYSSSGKYPQSQQWLTRALDWATEVGDRDMIATALSFKGHVAYRRGEVGPTIGLSAAAQRDPEVYVEQRAFSALQEARGHAMGADAAAAGGKLAEATDLIAEAVEQTGPIPPWSYYYRSPGFFDLVRGLVYRYLGHQSRDDNARAIEVFRAGRDALPEDMRESEWAGEFVYHLAIAHAQAGDLVNAAAVLEEARLIASATGSTRLRDQVERLARRL